MGQHPKLRAALAKSRMRQRPPAPNTQALLAPLPRGAAGKKL